MLTITNDHRGLWTTSLFELPEAYRPLAAEVRAVAAQLGPFAAEADASSELDPRVLEIVRSSRLCELTVPAEHGGRFEIVDPYAVCVAREVLMAVSSHADSLFALQGIGSVAIAMAGTTEQQAEWLPRVASLEVLAALALTEPDAGSDLQKISTLVEEQAGTLRVNGLKSFISNAGAADFYEVLVREGTRMSMVLVPADTDGVSTAPAPDLIAPHVLGEVRFDDVELPTSARIGAPGQGLELALATLALFRVSVAGAAIGLATAALEVAVRHTREREQFGRPLARLGPVAGHLADAWGEVAGARLLTYRAAELAREDPLGNLQYSSLAKVTATEAAGRAIDRCVQVMGRWGLVRDSRIERCYRQARPMRIYEGASEVLRLGIARELCEIVP